MNDKKYYWIKLRTDFFNREDIDFLLSQENGCEYVVLYQMLCLNTANTNGRLESQMNEVIVPYDVKKIARDTKYFDIDTIIVALELYKKLGLVYEEEDKLLKIANIERMIGTESASRAAIKKREQRLKKKMGTIEGTNCLIENRDKILDIRDKSIDIEIDSNIGTHRFKKPTLEEVKAYCKERNNNVDAERFIDFYESKGWKVGKEPMKDWKACVRTWEKKTGWSSEIEPTWMNQEIPERKATKEEEQEIKDLLSEFYD